MPTSKFIEAIPDGHRIWIEKNPTQKLFRLACEEGLKKRILGTREFIELYHFLPAPVQDRTKAGDYSMRLFKECFGPAVDRKARRLEKRGKEYFSGRFWGWQRTKVYPASLTKILPALFSKNPHEGIHRLLKKNGGRLGGFGLSRFSELCHMCRPTEFPVVNKRTVTRFGINDRQYVEYATVARELILLCDYIGFPEAHRFGYLDMLTNDEIRRNIDEDIVSEIDELLNIHLGRAKSDPDLGKDISDEFEDEGQETLRTIQKLDRQRSRRNRRLFLLLVQDMRCEICGADVQENYGLESELIEVHHKYPLSYGKTELDMEMLSALCPNCHRALHRFLAEKVKKKGKDVIADRKKALRLHGAFVKRCKELGVGNGGRGRRNI